MLWARYEHCSSFIDYQSALGFEILDGKPRWVGDRRRPAAGENS